MQLVAPVSVSVSVIEPPGHAVHAICPVLFWYSPAAQPVHATVETVLYFPAAQSVQLVAPVSDSVSVVEPAWHTVHTIRPEPFWYSPAVQFAHGTLEAVLY